MSVRKTNKITENDPILLVGVRSAFYLDSFLFLCLPLLSFMEPQSKTKEKKDNKDGCQNLIERINDNSVYQSRTCIRT